MGSRTILAVILSIMVSPGLAQRAGTGLSTAPGMPLMVGQRVTTPYSPAKIIAPSPRFWLRPDSSSHRHAQALSQLLARRTGLPNAFTRHKDYTTHADENTLVTLFFSTIIQPNGAVGAVTLLQQTGNKEHVYSPESIALLVAEGQRAIKTLKFESSTTQDTLVVPLRFRL